MRLTALGAFFISFVCLGGASSFAQVVSVPPSPPPLIDAAPASNDDQPVVELPGPQTNAAPSAPAAPAPAPAPVITTTEVADGVEAENFEDWALECFGEGEGCQITHRVLAAEGSQIVVVLALLAEAEDGPVELQIAVPLGVSTTAGARLTIGNEYQANIPIARCTPQGCLIEGTASQALMAGMRRGTRGQLGVVNEAGTSIDLPFSLMGFTAAFAEMVARNGTEQ